MEPHESIRGVDVLFVEDSVADVRLVVHELMRGGWDPRWERVETVEGLRAALPRRPWHLVIADSSIPRLDPLRALGVTRESLPDVPFIVVSGTFTEEAAARAMRAGAADWVNKGELHRLRPVVARELAGLPARHAPPPASPCPLPPERLVVLRESLTRAARGLGDAPPRDLLDAVRLVEHALGAVRAPETPLTPRQREVLVLVAEGYSTKEIAARLGLSAKTVETHRAQVMERVGAHNVAGLVRYAVRAGIVTDAP